ncbi:hypothetical protein TRFO_18030 [Tritrichomonas foetus]|uniref:E2F/DP family winged-helix DNA-binding domain-containing protein n=1 Tax=Tritrichomonas foetus TaxID=1144522 RepID=A0A1J4KLY3_9EUKA|nr:hypothetical protein TRFO_18030 [Tritrichomonas foetus]|eukprot:OHT12227.1 hypothetical protein TRFO_18030 [Tritrichomonas foetus]
MNPSNFFFQYKCPLPKAKTTKPLVNDSQNISVFVKFVESNQHFNQPLSLSKMCEKFNIKRRVLYDFISILFRFEICSKISSEHFFWFGLEKSKNAITALKKDVENKSDEELRADLNCVAEPSLPHIAVAIIQLFFYLNVKLIDLRQACCFLAVDQKKYKTLLRKLYTVSARLEVAKIIEKTTNIAEVRLINFPETPNKILSIEQMMNTNEELKAESIYSARRKEYENFNSLRNSKNGVNNINGNSTNRMSMSSSSVSSASTSSPESMIIGVTGPN